MKTSVFVSLILGVSSAFAAADMSLLKATEKSNELESKAISLSRGIENPGTGEFSLQNVLQRRFFLKYNDVMKNLHSDVENETDIVYLVNTSDARNHCSNLESLSLPNQHMVMLKRTSPGAPLFNRDGSGQILEINSQGALVAALTKQNGVINYKVKPQFKSLNELTENDTAFIPVSSGIPGGNRILTYSGIFRVNERRTNDMRKSTNTTSDPMQWSVYINGEYNDGGEARLALHGTSQKAWGLLGVQRASSGCIRLQSDFSKWNQELLFDRASDGQLVPKPEITGPVKVWSRRDHFPPSMQTFERLESGKKLKVLVIFFDGYSSTCS